MHKLTLWGTMSLGALLDALAALPDEARVYYDRWHARPWGLASYLGYDDHLALGCVLDDNVTLVYALRAQLASAVGAVFAGRKGGKFRVTRETPVWSDNLGICSGTRIVAVHPEPTEPVACVRLVTDCEPWA